MTLESIVAATMLSSRSKASSIERQGDGECVLTLAAWATGPIVSLIGFGVKDVRLSGESSTPAIACKGASKKLHFGAMTNRLDSTRELSTPLQW